MSGKNINISIPEAKILSHEIDEKSIEVFDETKNIFNQISITDYNQFAIDQKESMENKAKEKGLLEEAQNKAQETIKTFVESMYSSDDEYKIEIKMAES